MLRIVSALATFALFIACAPPAVAEQFHIAFWNVENLFDLEDDPNVELDEDFTPQSPKRWTAERLETKLKNLSSIIRKLNAGRGPDVLGLCEVENRTVVEMLVAALAPLGRKYEILHQDSPSDRGIDCALVYDAGIFGLADSKFHFVDAEKTRDIIEARLRHDGSDLFVFVNHWPSLNNDEWQRIKAATVLRKRLDEILLADAAADIVMGGDFNDEPDNVSLTHFLLSVTQPENAADGKLYDTTAHLAAEGKGTYVFDNKWELIDHILVSPGLLNRTGFSWRADSSQRIEYPEMIYHPRWANAIPRPSRSYSSNDFHANGYSDHLPVACVIEKQ
jgi:endonuclease/exonuclease/phosphatase family metal-dependent hydrolase